MFLLRPELLSPSSRLATLPRDITSYVLTPYLQHGCYSLHRRYITVAEGRLVALSALKHDTIYFTTRYTSRSNTDRDDPYQSIAAILARPQPTIRLAVLNVDGTVQPGLNYHGRTSSAAPPLCLADGRLLTWEQPPAGAADYSHVEELSWATVEEVVVRRPDNRWPDQTEAGVKITAGITVVKPTGTTSSGSVQVYMPAGGKSVLFTGAYSFYSLSEYQLCYTSLTPDGTFSITVVINDLVTAGLHDVQFSGLEDELLLLVGPLVNSAGFISSLDRRVWWLDKNGRTVKSIALTSHIPGCELDCVVYTPQHNFVVLTYETGSMYLHDNNGVYHTTLAEGNIPLDFISVGQDGSIHTAEPRNSERSVILASWVYG